MEPKTILTLEESCFALPQESMTDALVSKRNLDCFFNHRGTVHYESAPECQLIKIFIWRF
jgi:hypothetical protein